MIKALGDERRTSDLQAAQTLDFNLGFVFAGLGEVVGKLHSQPRFRRAAEVLG